MKVNISKEEFVKLSYPCANKIRKDFNIALIISISQSALSSMWGNTDLVIKGYNLFNIRPDESWEKRNKETIYGWTYEDGHRIKCKYKKYDNWLESFVDWAVMISSQGKYKTAYKYAILGMVKEFGDEIGNYGQELFSISQEVRQICEKIGLSI
jgi:flagellum-specific peptidoglycan hydrolase FlgJ